MLFHGHDSLQSQFVEGIEQSPRVIFETITPEMNQAKGDEKQLNFCLNVWRIELNLFAECCCLSFSW